VKCQHLYYCYGLKGLTASGEHNTAAEFAIMSTSLDVNARTNCVIGDVELNAEQPKGQQLFGSRCPMDAANTWLRLADGVVTGSVKPVAPTWFLFLIK